MITSKADVALGSRVWARSAALLTGPVALAVLNLFHPHLGMELPRDDWFLALHLVQLPLLLLAGIAAETLTDGLPGVASEISRWGARVFVAFYCSYDTLFGIMVGLLAQVARGLPSDQAEVVTRITFTILAGPWPIALAHVGTLGWVVSLLAAAVALSRAGTPLGARILLAWAGLFLLGDHPPPFGPISFTCFALGAFWMMRSQIRSVP